MSKRSERDVAKRSERNDDESAARLARAAHAAFGEQPETDEEAAVIAALRKELPRPTAEEIVALAKKLARRTD